MAGVRFLAWIFLCLGWLTLALSALTGVGSLSEASQVLERGDTLLAVGSAIILPIAGVLVSLAGFFCWAVLTALSEIHDRIAASNRRVTRRPTVSHEPARPSYWEDRARRLRQLRGPLL